MKLQKQSNQSNEHISGKIYFLLGGILLLSFLLYFNSLKNDVVHFDDDEYFTKYPEILSLRFQNIKTYFTHYYVLMYQPLPVLTFALQYSISGMNSYPLHLINTILHLINILLVFRFTFLLTRHAIISLIPAVIFAIHPMNVEAVAWISARSSGMYTMFYLLAACSYLLYLKNDLQKKHLVLAFMFFVLSLFSKVQAITFPVLLLLFDFYYDRKLNSSKVWLEKIPFFLVSLIFGAVAVMNESTMENITSGMMISYSWIDRVFLIPYSFVFYMVKFMIPAGLCAIHVYPMKTNGMLPMEYYASLPVFAFLLYMLYRFRKNKIILLGAGLFLITISVNIQMVPSRLFIVADRYAYFPFLGLILIPVLLMHFFSKNNKVMYDRYLIPSIAVLAFFVLYSMVAVVQRIPDWNNDGDLMTDIINKNAEVPYISRAYGTRGNFFKSIKQNELALNDYTNAIRIKPDDAASYINRSLIESVMLKHKDALEDVNKGIELQAKNALYVAYRSIIRFQSGDTVNALIDCNEALKIDSTTAEAYNERAVIHFKSGDYISCENDLSKAIFYKPNYGEAYKNRGTIFYLTKRPDIACKDWIKAESLGSEEAKAIRKQYCR